MFPGVLKISPFAVLFGLAIQLVSFPASAGPVELRELTWLLRPLFEDTYEGYALADRVLGRPLHTLDDAEEFANRLHDPRYRDPALAPELERRLGQIENGLSARGEGALGELARQELTLAPLRVSERIEFLAVDGVPLPGYTASREAFLAAAAAADSRDVLIHVSMGYGRFRPALLARLQAAGLRLKPGFDNSSIFLGRAAMKDLARISGLDGIDSLEAFPKPANSRLGQPAYAPMYYRHGQKILTY